MYRLYSTGDCACVCAFCVAWCVSVVVGLLVNFSLCVFWRLLAGVAPWDYSRESAYRSQMSGDERRESLSAESYSEKHLSRIDEVNEFARMQKCSWRQCLDELTRRRRDGIYWSRKDDGGLLDERPVCRLRPLSHTSRSGRHRHFLCDGSSNLLAVLRTAPACPLLVPAARASESCRVLLRASPTPSAPWRHMEPLHSTSAN